MSKSPYEPVGLKRPHGKQLKRGNTVATVLTGETINVYPMTPSEIKAKLVPCRVCGKVPGVHTDVGIFGAQCIASFDECKTLLYVESDNPAQLIDLWNYANRKEESK